jgi:spermidine synthase
MEIWFSELHTSNVKLSVRIDKQLFSGESEYQTLFFQKKMNLYMMRW